MCAQFGLPFEPSWEAVGAKNKPHGRWAAVLPPRDLPPSAAPVRATVYSRPALASPRSPRSLPLTTEPRLSGAAPFS
jgi:hypothetical protein